MFAPLFAIAMAVIYIAIVARDSEKRAKLQNEARTNRELKMLAELKELRRAVESLTVKKY